MCSKELREKLLDNFFAQAMLDHLALRISQKSRSCDRWNFSTEGGNFRPFFAHTRRAKRFFKSLMPENDSSAIFIPETTENYAPVRFAIR